MGIIHTFVGGHASIEESAYCFLYKYTPYLQIKVILLCLFKKRK